MACSSHYRNWKCAPNVLNIKERPVLYCSIRLCVCVSAVKQEETVLPPALDGDDDDDNG